MENGMQPESLDSAAREDAPRNGSWRERIILGEQCPPRSVPEWLAGSYETLRGKVMDPAYPCFFGTQAEKRGEMFYSYVTGRDWSMLPATMRTFARLSALPQYQKNNIAIFFEPDREPRGHDAYREDFWRILQGLHDVDPDPAADSQPDPDHADWEFSFAGVQMFVVCACPSFRVRHSRNLGPGMVLLFQPRSVFIDKVTNRVIGLQARTEVRRRLERWDDIGAHPDLGFYGDPDNREWKQYFLPDDNTAASRCPFLNRRHAASDRTATDEEASMQTPVRLKGKGL
jgi:FPC/CPF motif-containing protein YcgG